MLGRVAPPPPSPQLLLHILHCTADDDALRPTSIGLRLMPPPYVNPAATDTHLPTYLRAYTYSFLFFGYHCKSSSSCRWGDRTAHRLIWLCRLSLSMAERMPLDGVIKHPPIKSKSWSSSFPAAAALWSRPGANSPVLPLSFLPPGEFVLLDSAVRNRNLCVLRDRDNSERRI